MESSFKSELPWAGSDMRIYCLNLSTVNILRIGDPLPSSQLAKEIIK